MSPSEINELAQIIWDYHHLNHGLKKTEAILVLGSHDVRVAEYASDLYLAGYAPLLIFSGGFGHLTQGVFAKPEAELFAEIAVRRGVPRASILKENRSTNTGENIVMVRTLLQEKGLNTQSFIVVQKPYMERRSYATFKKVWPEPEIIVTSPPILFADYPIPGITREQVINIMVGDLQRIKIYPDKGFQIPQAIPQNVWSAYEKLVAVGFTNELV